MHDDRVTTLAGDALRLRCIEAVIEEGERFGIVAQELAAGLTPVQGGLDVPVPWIPAWTARELVQHLGTVHRWATSILRAGSADHPPKDSAGLPHADGLLDWYASGLVELVATLRTTAPDAPAWHMSPTAPKVAASWARRQAHELVIHRMDLEAAAGLGHPPLDAHLAADGVDELLSIVVPRWAHTEPLISADAMVAVTATDTGDTWTVTVHRGTVTVGRGETGPSDAHVRGPAAALLLHLWGRPADVVVDGDPGAEALLRGR